MIAIRVSDEQREVINKAALTLNVPYSRIIQWALDDWFRRRVRFRDEKGEMQSVRWPKPEQFRRRRRDLPGGKNVEWRLRPDLGGKHKYPKKKKPESDPEIVGQTPENGQAISGSQTPSQTQGG